MRHTSARVWLAVVVLLANLYALIVPDNSLVMAWFNVDDAFYYFKTAQNIAEGHGITFDGIGLANGFHPLWMLICVPIFALSRIDLVLPLRVVVLVSILLHTGTVLLVYELAKRAFHSGKVALIAGLLWGFLPLIHTTVVEQGMEAGISAFFIALLLLRLTAQASSGTAAQHRLPIHLIVTGLIGALALFSRLDNIFFVLAAGIWVTVQPRRGRYLMLADLALSVFGVLWAYFVRVGLGPSAVQAGPSSYWMAALAPAFRIFLYYLAGLYHQPAPGTRGLSILLGKAALASLLASVLLAAAMLGLSALQTFPSLPRLTLIYEAGFGLAAVLVTRAISWWVRGRVGDTQISIGVPQGLGTEPGLDWRTLLVRGLCYFAPVAILLVLYMGWNQVTFGTAMPVSGQVKRWWGTLPNPIYGRPIDSLAGLLGYFGPKPSGPWMLIQKAAAWPALLPGAVRLALYGGLTGALVVMRRVRLLHAVDALALFPLFVGGFVKLISYTGTGYLHMRTWYWGSEMLLSVLLLAALLDAFLSLFKQPEPGTKRTGPTRWVDALVMAMIVLLPLAGTYDLVRRLPLFVSQENQTYYLVGINELEAETEPGSRIGSTGGGVIAYFVQDRTIINLDGLMNSTEYFHLLQAGHAAEYLDQIHLDYLYTSSYPITSSDPYFQFKGRFVRLKDFGGSTLFRWQ